LLKEIAALGKLAPGSVVLIDDARLFLAPPPPPHDVSQWPKFEEIDAALRRASDAHELMVVNDLIAFYPRSVNAAMHAFARKHGIDWLRAVQALEENDSIRDELAAREAVIKSNEKQLMGKDELINSLHKAAAQREDLINSLHEAARQGQVREKDLAREIAFRDSSLGDKEKLIEKLDTALRLSDGLSNLNSVVESAELNRRLMKDLDAKESVIKEVSGALDQYRSAPSAWQRVLRRWTAAIRPRLGMLYQYDPKPLDIPAHYADAPKVDAPPKISIVTPSFRQAAFIERTIQSVLDQKYPNLEYWVQDGGSDDGTVQILERYAPQIAGWESRKDSGQSEAINAGFAHTSGDIMAWLNSDDVLLPGALAYVADFFTRNPDVDVVYGHRININAQDHEIGRWMMPPHNAGVLSWADFVPQETLFWRRATWDKAGGRIDESFKFAMDWDLLVRFREAGARFARLPRFIGGFRIHPQQKTSANITDVGFQEMNRIRQRALGRVPTHKEVRRALVPYMLSHVATDLGWRVKTRLGMQA
jgi:GT2 family glycosyltransferase